MALHAEETQTCLHLIAPSCCGRGWQHFLMKNCLYSSFFFFTCANKAIFIHSSRRRTQRSLTRRDSSAKFPFVTSWQLGNRVVLRKQNLDKWGEVPENLISRKKSVHINSCRCNVDPSGQLLWLTKVFPHRFFFLKGYESTHLFPPPRLLNCQLCGVVNEWAASAGWLGPHDQAWSQNRRKS